MARRKFAAPLAMDLFRPLQRDGAVLLADQLIERVAGLIATGRLAPGEFLPPLRLLAAKLKVNVGTVAKAYEALCARDLVAPDSTRGLRVRRRVVATPQSGTALAGLLMTPTVPADPLGTALPHPTGARVVRFHVSEPGVDLMPARLVEDGLKAALADAGGLRYAPLSGLPHAHAAVEAYLRRRGVAVADADILLTTGTTQSLAVVTRALLPTGGVVLAEHPTWHVALSVFAAAGARVVAVPVDEQGLQTSVLPDAVLRHNPAFLYLQPAFQNPTGVSLSAERRAAIMALARKYQLPIVEDDFAGEVGFSAPSPPLRNADGSETVIYLKSFAKLIAPALRVGILVAPARYAAAFRRIQHGLDPFVPAITQRALAFCLTSPRFEEHLTALRAALAERWAALDRALRRQMPAGMSWTHPSGGFCAWLTLPARMSPDDFIRDAAKRGVDLAPGRLFCLDDSGNRGLRLAFAAVTPGEIKYGVDVMARLIDSSARARRGGQRLPTPVAP